MQQELGRKDVITWTKRGNNLKRRGDQKRREGGRERVKS